MYVINDFYLGVLNYHNLLPVLFNFLIFQLFVDRLEFLLHELGQG